MKHAREGTALVARGADPICPLCRRTFEPSTMGCHTGCPMVRHCGALCCPHCGYEFIDTRRTEESFARWGRAVRGVTRLLARARTSPRSSGGANG